MIGAARFASTILLNQILSNGSAIPANKRWFAWVLRAASTCKTSTISRLTQHESLLKKSSLKIPEWRYPSEDPRVKIHQWTLRLQVDSDHHSLMPDSRIDSLLVSWKTRQSKYLCVPLKAFGCKSDNVSMTHCSTKFRSLKKILKAILLKEILLKGDSSFLKEIFLNRLNRFVNSVKSVFTKERLY